MLQEKLSPSTVKLGSLDIHLQGSACLKEAVSHACFPCRLCNSICTKETWGFGDVLLMLPTGCMTNSERSSLYDVCFNDQLLGFMYVLLGMLHLLWYVPDLPVTAYSQKTFLNIKAERN